ncbi:MAG: hypothetical protein ABL872_04805 [Lacibacter sp.]
MKKRFSFYPHSIFEVTSDKDLKGIYDQFYQQMILKDSETRIAFISKDDRKQEYQFEVYREYIILHGNMRRSVKGNISGWGILTKNNNKVECKVFLKSGSVSTSVILFILFICLLGGVSRAIVLNQFELSTFLFLIALGVIGYLYSTSTMKRQMRIAIAEIDSAVK